MDINAADIGGAKNTGWKALSERKKGIKDQLNKNDELILKQSLEKNGITADSDKTAYLDALNEALDDKKE